MKNYYCKRKKCCIAYLIVLTICKMFALVGKFLSSGIFEIRKIQKDSEFKYIEKVYEFLKVCKM